MRRIILFLLFIFTCNIVLSQPANNNCNNATSLTSGTNVCNQNSTNATLQTNECYITFSGSQRSMWYSFTASTSTMVLSFLQTNITNCYPYYVVYGPYSSVSAGCSIVLSPTIACSANGGTVLSTATPSSYVGNASGLYYNLVNGDPGNYISLNGLNTTPGNNTYLVQMVNNNCGGPYSRWAQFCIGIYPPASNAAPSGASNINSCGSQFNGTTQGGYAPLNCMQGTGGFGNIDCNASTSCPGSFGGNCNGSNGNDVPFVINNPSFFNFCASATGTYNINFIVNNCTQSMSGAQGAQMAILIGSATSMTLNQVATNPTLPGSTWTSSNFSLSAGQCAYLVVDGFAGDQCTYSYTLNNVAGGCNVLPIELISYAVDKYNSYNKIYWTTATEKNNAYFTLEKSSDGINFQMLGKISGAGDSYFRKDYEYIDEHPFNGITYYQLSQTDYDGITKKLGIISVQNTMPLKDIEIKPNPIKDKVYISIPSIQDDNVTISIKDISGKVIGTNETNLKSGDNYFEIDTEPLEKGIYFIEISNRYTNKVFKVYKQ